MRSAQARSCSGTSGLQMNNFSRLGVRVGPVAAYGPTSCMGPTRRGRRRYPLKANPSYWVPPAINSSVATRERSMNVTTTSHTPRHPHGGIGATLHELGAPPCAAPASHERARPATPAPFPEDSLSLAHHDH